MRPQAMEMRAVSQQRGTDAGVLRHGGRRVMTNAVGVVVGTHRDASAGNGNRAIWASQRPHVIARGGRCVLMNAVGVVVGTHRDASARHGNGVTRAITVCGD